MLQLLQGSELYLISRVENDEEQAVPPFLAKYEKGKANKQWKVADAEKMAALLSLPPSQRCWEQKSMPRGWLRSKRCPSWGATLSRMATH